MQKFAHIIEDENVGQVLIVLGDDADEPSITISLIPDDGFGVCSSVIKFNDEETAKRKFDQAVKDTKSEEVLELAKSIKANILKQLKRLTAKRGS